MRGPMAAAETRHVRRTWPIVYDRPVRTAPSSGVRLAWALFLGAGLPFALMAVLTMLARAGIYIELLRPLWQPWPPDLLKPLLGVAVFAATLAYLAYRMGKRSGFRTGAAVGFVSARNRSEDRGRETTRVTAETEEKPSVPPPPPEDSLFDL